MQISKPCPLRVVNRVTLTARRELLLFPDQQTSPTGCVRSENCRYCSLIPGLGVKLSTIILAGPTVLSAVGVNPPHDGVR